MELARVVGLGFVLGLSVAAQIGPISVLAVTVAATRGFLRGACIGLGAATADMLYASAGLVVGDAASRLGPLVSVLTAIAGIALVILGTTSIRSALAFRRSPADAHTKLGMERAATNGLIAFRTGTFLTLANVQTIAFWVAVMTGSHSARPPGTWNDLALIGGIGAGTAAWFSIVAAAGAAVLSRSTRLWAVQLAGGAVLLAFGTALIGRSVTA